MKDKLYILYVQEGSQSLETRNYDLTLSSEDTRVSSETYNNLTIIKETLYYNSNM